MDSSDFFWTLPLCLLIPIISSLPFKESVRTSVLSKSWRNLCRETTNLVFKESEFVNLSVFNEETIETIKRERGLFVDIMRQWISSFMGNSIETFELYLSEVEGFETDIMSIIEFATSKQVKTLVLDFTRRIGAQEHFPYPDSNLDISQLVFNLLYVKNLTICPFLLQMIQRCDNPMELHNPMQTQHLVMKTYMHANEFEGISIFLNCCPQLESLTFDVVTTQLILRPCLTLDPETYWLSNEAYECLEKTLKVVKVKNFRGGENELHVLWYLIRTCLLMERLELYEAEGLEDSESRLVLAGMEEVRRFTRGSEIRNDEAFSNGQWIHLAI